MKRKIRTSNILVFILKNITLILVVICCGCGEEQQKPSPPPREYPKKEQPRIPNGSGGMDNRGNSVK